MFEEPNFCRLIQWDIEGGRHPTEEDNLVAAGGCLRPRREPADHPRPNFPVDLLSDPPSPPNPPWCHLPWRHGEGAADSIGVRVSEGHGGHPPWLMNSEYLGDLVGRALWAKYRDNGWSQPGDRGTNMDLGSGEQANRFPGLAFSLVILSSMLLLPTQIGSFISGFSRPLKICCFATRELERFPSIDHARASGPQSDQFEI